MASVGYATLDVIPSFKGLSRELDRGTAGPLAAAGTKGGTLFGDKAGKAAGSRFGSVFKKAAKAGLVGLAGAAAGAVKLGMDSISLASDLEESTNKVAQVFGDGADSVFKFSEKAADALGQTNTQAREAAATFGIFGSAAGLADRKNARFAKRMTTLASDLASFNNTDPSQAVEALGAALRGESEPIRAFGVMLDEATLKAEAMRLGLLKPVKDKSKIFAYQTRVTDLQRSYNEAVKEHGKDSLEALKAEASLGTARTALQKATEGTLPPLTKQQKLLAAQSEIFKQTNVAQGDFARTSDGLANQQRRLSARFEDAKAKLGVGLLPIMTKAADFLLDKGIPAFEDFAAWFNDKGIPALKDFGGFVEDASGKVGDLIGFVKDLPKPAQFAGLAALIGGAGALKLRGGKGGALGTVGSALGLTKPVPVFVTNKGFGAGVGGPGGKPTSIAKGAAKSLPPVLVIGGLAYAVDSLVLDPARKGATRLEPTRQGWDSTLASIQGVENKAKGFGRELDLIGAKKVEPKFAVPGLAKSQDGLKEFLRLQVQAGKPITPYIFTGPIERAIAAMERLNAEIARNVQPQRGIDNGVPYLHGSGASSNPRAGVNFNGPIHVQAHDYNDFTRQLERKTQRAGLGGRP